MNINQIKAGLRYILVPGSEQPITPFLWGAPGIGKSALVKQLAQELTQKTGNFYHHIDLRLAQLESADIRGIPETQNESCHWFAPDFLPFTISETYKNTYGILMLDELNRARSDVMQSAFQLVLDRQVGSNKLLDTWFIIAAGNYGEQDQTDVNEMDSALKNRFMHMEVEVDLNTWVAWATKAHIHEDVLGFIQINSSYLNYSPKEGDNLLVTPRSWEKFSDILKQNPNVDPREICLAVGKTLISTATAQFAKYLESKDVISARDIGFNYDKIASRLNTLTRDQLLQLTIEITNWIIKELKDNLPSDQQAIVKQNIFKFSEENLEADTQLAFFKNLATACSVNNFSTFVISLFQDHHELNQKIYNVLLPGLK